MQHIDVAEKPYRDATGELVLPHLKCDLGAGCPDCGGIGAVGDNTHYEAMGREMERSLSSPTSSAKDQEARS